jgi:hypothetical protein
MAYDICKMLEGPEPSLKFVVDAIKGIHCGAKRQEQQAAVGELTAAILL